MIDLTKPIEPVPGAWSPMPISIKYLDTTVRGAWRYVWFKAEYENGESYYHSITDGGLSEFVRNVRTLAERCKEELQGATEVRVWGAAVKYPGIVCKFHFNPLGMMCVEVSILLTIPTYIVNENFALNGVNAYVTPVTWTPEEAAQLAEELGL